MVILPKTYNKEERGKNKKKTRIKLGMQSNSPATLGLHGIEGS